MSNFIWYNLPTKIKENLDLDTRWFSIVKDINVLLRELEISNNALYSNYYKPNYKVNWFNLLIDLEKILVIYEG